MISSLYGLIDPELSIIVINRVTLGTADDSIICIGRFANGIASLHQDLTQAIKTLDMLEIESQITRAMAANYLTTLGTFE
jgi:hypothetical protein